jgi:hypothetical protein
MRITIGAEEEKRIFSHLSKKFLLVWGSERDNGRSTTFEAIINNNSIKSERALLKKNLHNVCLLLCWDACCPSFVIMFFLFEKMRAKTREIFICIVFSLWIFIRENIVINLWKIYLKNKNTWMQFLIKLRLKQNRSWFNKLYDLYLGWDWNPNHLIKNP